MKPTFKEWMEKNPPKCKCCNKVLPSDFAGLYKEAGKLTDVDGERIKGFYCKDCYNECDYRLQESRWVAEHDNQKIYEKDGRYYPYWGAPYYFKTLEDCRTRIDAKHIAITPFGMISIDKLLEVIGGDN
jgi:hypothetical protein